MAAKILIVDDHDVVRQGTRAILQKARPDWEICGEAATGQEAISAVVNYHPDVVILDISMPDMTGIEATPAIAKFSPQSKILLFTMHESDALLVEARELGVQGYVQKTQAGRDLVQAVDRLLAGGTFFGPQGKSEAAAAGEAAKETGSGGVSRRVGLREDQTFRSVMESMEIRKRAGKFVGYREDLAVREPESLRLKRCGSLIWKHLAAVDSGVRVAFIGFGNDV